MIELVILGVPLCWKAPYVGTRGAFSPRFHHMNFMREIVAEQYKGPLLDQAVICDLAFFMPIPKAASKKRRLQMLCGMIRPEGTPDRINLGKLAEDFLQGIVLKNDSKIVGGKVEKFYGAVPRTEIKITLLDLLLAE